MQKYPLLIRLTVSLFFAILLVYALIEVRNFLYPLTLAVLIAYLLYPLVKFLENRKIPRIPAILFSIISAIVIISGAIYLLSTQVGVFVDDFPALKEQTLKNIETLNTFISKNTGMELNIDQEFIKERLSELFQTGSDFLQTAFSATTGTIAKIALLPVYAFFLLYYRNKFAMFVFKLIPEEKHAKINKILQDVSHVTKRYMGGIFIVVLILCFLNSLGLLIVGVKYALLLGIVSALFNFIPYFGTLIGGAVPLLFVLLMSDTPEKGFSVVILFLIIQFTENNILTPNIVGGYVRLNPFMIILSIIIGGMVWGLPGMFISVPFLGMFKILCEQVAILRPYAFLLGTEGTEKHAVDFQKVKSFFSKLIKPKKTVDHNG